MGPQGFRKTFLVVVVFLHGLWEGFWDLLCLLNTTLNPKHARAVGWLWVCRVGSLFPSEMLEDDDGSRAGAHTTNHNHGARRHEHDHGA